jgi:hypothetical protein
LLEEFVRLRGSSDAGPTDLRGRHPRPHPRRWTTGDRERPTQFEQRACRADRFQASYLVNAELVCGERVDLRAGGLVAPQGFDQAFVCGCAGDVVRLVAGKIASASRRRVRVLGWGWTGGPAL